MQTQTAELTRTTKEIEAKISDELWNRQRRWELKRDLLLEMSKKISGAYDALTLAFAMHQTQKAAPAADGQQEPERMAFALGLPIQKPLY